MSCIYGLHQFGNEDQGWVAHFLIRAIEDLPITIYGDGKQVRDILFIDDLVDAFLLAQKDIGTLSGKSFNIGGGPRNTVSLLELLDYMKRLHGEIPKTNFEESRAATNRITFQISASFPSRLVGHQGSMPPKGFVVSTIG